MTQAKRAPMEADGVQFEIEPLESVEGVQLRSPAAGAASSGGAASAPPGGGVGALRERLRALEKDLDEVEKGYEARLADLMQRLAAADAREAERKAALKELVSKLQ